MRRDDHGIAKLARYAQLIVAVLATVALALAAVNVNAEINSRRDSARDFCRVLRGVVFSATPPGRLPEARAFVKRNHLQDCDAFATRIVK